MSSVGPERSYNLKTSNTHLLGPLCKKLTRTGQSRGTAPVSWPRVHAPGWCPRPGRTNTSSCGHSRSPGPPLPAARWEATARWLRRSSRSGGWTCAWRTGWTRSPLHRHTKTTGAGPGDAERVLARLTLFFLTHKPQSHCTWRGSSENVGIQT